jgi:integrase/recombinase XerD
MKGIEASVVGLSEKTRCSMKRAGHPPLSPAGQEALASYEHWLREREDLASASIRNYLSDLRHFIAWYETEREAQVHDSFTPQGITTSALTRYRTYLQTARRQKSASVNRSFISLKRYFLQQAVATIAWR